MPYIVHTSPSKWPSERNAFLLEVKPGVTEVHSTRDKRIVRIVEENRNLYVGKTAASAYARTVARLKAEAEKRNTAEAGEVAA